MIESLQNLECFIFSSDDASGKNVWELDDQIYTLDLAADEWLDTGFSGRFRLSNHSKGF